MSPQRPPIVEPDKVNEEIAAYLDGELSGNDAREVEERLSVDGRYRQSVLAYQQTWELLDQLPRDEADPDFVATTVEMVAVAASDDLVKHRWLGQFLRQWSVVGFSVLAACIVGFLVTSGVAALLHGTGVITDPNEKLLVDLPLLENLDKYSVGSDLEFIRTYGGFPHSEIDDQVPTPELGTYTILNETIEQRRQRVAAMSSAEKRSLSTKQERFEELTPDQQQELRKLQADLIADPQFEQLAAALDRYYEFHKMVSPQLRDELQVTRGDDRVEVVKQARSAEEQRVLRERILSDVQAVVSWGEKFAAAHEKLLVSGLRPSQPDVPEGVRQRQLFLRLVNRWQNQGGPVDPEISPEDFSQLKQSVSPALRKELEDAGDAAAAWKYLVDNFPHEVRRVLAANAENRLAASATPRPNFPWASALVADGRPSRDQLMKFFREELTPEEQSRLERLPQGDFVNKLRQLYFRSKFKARAPRPSASSSHRALDSRLRNQQLRGAENAASTSHSAMRVQARKADVKPIAPQPVDQRPSLTPASGQRNTATDR